MKKSKFQVPSSKPKGVSYRVLRRGKSEPLAVEVRTNDAMELHEGLASPSSPDKPYDLEERTAVFGEEVVRFAKKIPKGPGNNRLIDQVVGAGTSLGANYAEASETVSPKDFKHTISRCVKEGEGDAVLSSHDCGGGTATGGRGTSAISRSPGTSSHLRQHVSEMKFQIPNSKSQTRDAGGLRLEASLELGTWDLEFFNL